MPTKDEMAKFAKAIESLVANTDYNHIEAIVEHINSNLKAKITSDAMDLNLLKEKGSRLPI
jgi:hypothetical protein